MRAMTVLLALALSMFLPARVAAQSQITTAVIEGVVADTSGAVLPGVMVEIRNVDTNFTRTLVLLSAFSSPRFIGPSEFLPPMPPLMIRLNV